MTLTHLHVLVGAFLGTLFHTFLVIFLVAAAAFGFEVLATGIGCGVLVIASWLAIDLHIAIAHLDFLAIRSSGGWLSKAFCGYSFDINFLLFVSTVLVFVVRLSIGLWLVWWEFWWRSGFGVPVQMLVLDYA